MYERCYTINFENKILTVMVQKFQNNCNEKSPIDFIPMRAA